MAENLSQQKSGSSNRGSRLIRPASEACFSDERATPNSLNKETGTRQAHSTKSGGFRRRTSAQFSGGDTTGYASSPHGKARAPKRRGGNRQRRKSRSAGSKDVRRLDKPVHGIRDSLFSSTSGYTNYRGFFNLALLLLFISNARVAIENVLKYGLLVDPVRWLSPFLADPYHWPNASLACLSTIFIVTTFSLERSLAACQDQDRATLIFEKLVNLAYGVNLTCVLVVPALVILNLQPNPLASSFCLGIYSCIFLKLVSYKQVNSWCRETRFKASDVSATESEQENNVMENGDHNNNHITLPPAKLRGVTKYPDNLTLGDMVYFMLAPTLCYELNYPRSPKIRRWFLARRLFEAVFLFMLIVGLSEQWILPLLKNAVVPLMDTNIMHMLERLLKLCIPNHIIWLMAFYGLFHSLLNAQAELLRFGDREFYRDWWNAQTIQYFWRTWNIPVHRWAVRHLYRPLLYNGRTKLQASLAVFLVSAFFHEYLVSVPLSMFRWWAFIGMLSQVPLQWMTESMFMGNMGNLIVWMSLILGQPLCTLMYLHDYYVIHFAGDPTIIPFDATPTPAYAPSL